MIFLFECVLLYLDFLIYTSLPFSGSRHLFSDSNGKEPTTLYTVCQAQKTKAIAAKKARHFCQKLVGTKAELKGEQKFRQAARYTAPNEWYSYSGQICERKITYLSHKNVGECTHHNRYLRLSNQTSCLC